MSDDKNTVDYLKDLEQENDALQAKVRELEQLVKHYEDCDAHRQKEWQADLDRLHQVEAENAALRAELAHSREREEMHSQLRQGNHMTDYEQFKRVHP